MEPFRTVPPNWFYRLLSITDVELRRLKRILHVMIISPYLTSMPKSDWSKLLEKMTPVLSDCEPSSYPIRLTKPTFQFILMLHRCASFVLPHFVDVDALTKLIPVAVQLRDRRISLETLKQICVEYAWLTDWLEQSPPFHNESRNMKIVGLFYIIYYIFHTSTIVIDRTSAEGDEWLNRFTDPSTMDVEGVRERGNMAFQHGNYMAACELYTLAIHINNGNYIAYANRAQALMKLRAYDEALCDGYWCVVLKPDWPKGWYRCVDALHRLRQTDDLLDMMKLAAEFHPNDSVLQKQRSTIMDEMHGREVPATVLKVTETSMPSQKSKSKRTRSKSKHRATNQETATRNTDSMSDSSTQTADGDSATGREKPCSTQAETSQKGAKPKKANSARSKVKVDEPKKCAKDMPSQAAGDSRPDSVEKQISDACLTHLTGPLSVSLRLGFEAMLSARAPAITLEHLQQAMTLNSTSNDKAQKLNDSEFRILLYAMGTCYASMDNVKRVHEGIDYFFRIIDLPPSNATPLAHLGLGQAYMKLHQFADAECHLQDALRHVHLLSICCWPGTTVLLKDSSVSVFQAKVQDCLVRCVPPTPIAICRYANCASSQPKAQIYTTDLDYDGYVMVTCFDQCNVKYHRACWDKIKSQEHISDKTILSRQCFTPDCTADVMTFTKVDDAGHKTEISNKIKKTVKKPKKPPVKSKPCKKSHKVEKKTENKVADDEVKQEEEEEETENVGSVSDAVASAADKRCPPKTYASDMLVTVLLGKKTGADGDRQDSVHATSSQRADHSVDSSAPLDLLADSAAKWPEFCIANQLYHLIRGGGYTPVDANQMTKADIEEAVFLFFSELLSTLGPVHKGSTSILREIAVLPECLDLYDPDDLVALLLRSLQFAEVQGFLCVTSDAIRACDLANQQEGAMWSRPLLECASFSRTRRKARCHARNDAESDSASEKVRSFQVPLSALPTHRDGQTIVGTADGGADSSVVAESSHIAMDPPSTSTESNHVEEPLGAIGGSANLVADEATAAPPLTEVELAFLTKNGLSGDSSDETDDDDGESADHLDESQGLTAAELAFLDICSSESDDSGDTY